MKGRILVSVLLGFLFILSSTGFSCRDPYYLVRDGVAVAKIVVPRYRPADADPCANLDRDYQAVCYAARDLQDEIRQMTAAGVVLPIEATDAPDPAPAEVEIHLGDTRCQAATADRLPFDRLTDEEAFFIQALDTPEGGGCTAGPKIFISGKRFADIVFYRNHGWGTRYGVYELLERELGVHWYFPGPLGRVAPTGLANVAVLDRNSERAPAWQVPDYKSREISGLVGIDVDWAIRNRVHNQYRTRWPFYHNVNLLLAAQVGDEVWRYYPDLWTYPTLPNGDPDPNGTPYIQAAGTNPPANPMWQPRLDPDHFDTYDQVAQRLAWYALGNAYEAISVGIMDSRDWHAPADLPKHIFQFTLPERDVYGIEYAGINRTIWRFLARTTERWLELGDHADQYLCTLAYNNATSPPDESVAIPRNLIVLVGGDRTTTWLDPSPGGPREVDRNYLISWARKAAEGGRLAMGEKYWGAEMFVPRYAPHLAMESIRWVYEDLPGEAGRAGPLVEGFRAESWPIWPFDGLKFWAAAKALWRVGFARNDDPMPAVYADLFEKAAEPMTEYFELLEATWTEFPAEHPELYAHHTERAQRLDRGDHFEWVFFPANIINFRDEPYLLAILRSRMGAMIGRLAEAKAAFATDNPKPLPYYRVLLFERGASFLAAMVRFEEQASAIEDMPSPGNLDQALAIYQAFLELETHWHDAADAYRTMCHPPAEQLPPGTLDDSVGVPRLGEQVYEAHFKDYLPTETLKARADAAIAWLNANGRPAEGADLADIRDQIWDWRNHPARDGTKPAAAAVVEAR